MKTAKKLWRWTVISWGVVCLSLALWSPVLAVPYVTPSDASYRGVSRWLVQDVVARDGESADPVLICDAEDYPDVVTDRTSLDVQERVELGFHWFLELWSASASQ